LKNFLKVLGSGRHGVLFPNLTGLKVFDQRSNSDVYVVGISVRGGQDVFRDLVGVSLRLSSGRKDEAGGTVLGMIFGRGKSI
jgi:hypothetical protein